MSDIADAKVRFGAKCMVVTGRCSWESDPIIAVIRYDRINLVRIGSSYGQCVIVGTESGNISLYPPKNTPTSDGTQERADLVGSIAGALERALEASR